MMKPTQLCDEPLSQCQIEIVVFLRNNLYKTKGVLALFSNSKLGRNGHLVGWKPLKCPLFITFAAFESLWIKNCIFCNSSNVKKNGHRRNVQMYFCRDCGRQFQSGQRIDNVCLWNDYLTEKRTISELSTLHKCSERTIRRRLSSVADSFTPIYPESATIILDTTYFSKTFGVMLFQDAASGRILHRRLSGTRPTRNTLRDSDALRRVELG